MGFLMHAMSDVLRAVKAAEPKAPRSSRRLKTVAAARNAEAS